MSAGVRLAVSGGCPCGIGPEVSVAAAVPWLDANPDATVTLCGDGPSIDAALALRGLTLPADGRLRVLRVTELSPDDRVPGAPGIAAGVSQRVAIDVAWDAVVAGEADAIVTAPVSKEAVTRAGVPFLGHTEYLAARAGVARVVMMFAGPKLRVSLVTTHHAISSLPKKLTERAVRETVEITARALSRDFGLARPRIVVAGFNPHAGEGGLLGDEEIRVVAPALDAARAALGDAAVITGPLPAEGAFRHARDRRYDAVIAMYHDQATIASKLLDFGDAVNVTLGLPLVRTSVDHGTAYDIAGQGVADPHGMTAALDLAARLARHRLAAK